MSWDKIENHLFSKYDVEGEDKELSNLMEEHDKEIRAKAIDELKNKVCMHFADWKYSEDDKCIKDLIELASESVEEIAEQMKAGGENE
jgi:hypothetical protein